MPRDRRFLSPDIKNPTIGLTDRIDLLEKAVAELQRRMPPAPRPISQAEHDDGPTITRGARIGPMPNREFLDELFEKTRAAHHHEVAAAEPQGVSDARLESEMRADFAICYHALAHCPRRADIDEKTDVVTWIDRAMNWRMDNGLSNASFWAAGFIYAALAHGIQVRIGRPISTTRFALNRWPGVL